MINEYKLRWKLKDIPYTIRTVDESEINYDDNWINREVVNFEGYIDGRNQQL
jgi:hypothetical protein